MGDILEGTPEFQRNFEARAPRHLDACPDIEGRDIDPRPRETNQRVVRHIMQAVCAESPYTPDMEWDLYHHCQRLEDENALPDGVTAEDIYQEYMRTFGGHNG